MIYHDTSQYITICNNTSERGRGAQLWWGCTLSPLKEVWFKYKGVHYKCSEVWWKCAPPTDQGINGRTIIHYGSFAMPSTILPYKATLSIFYGQRVLRHVEIVSDKKKSSLPAFIFIYLCQAKNHFFNTIGIEMSLNLSTLVHFFRHEPARKLYFLSSDEAKMCPSGSVDCKIYWVWPNQW